MAAPKRTHAERERDMVLVAQLYCAGTPQATIAERLKVSRQQITYDIRDLRARWLAESVEKIDQRKADELARIDNLERVAWEAWERSCADAETNHVKTIRGRTKADGDALPNLETLEKTTKGQAGDPRFLERVAWCINKRCELLGLDAPKKLSGPDGGSIPITFIEIPVDPLHGTHRGSDESGGAAGVAAEVPPGPAASMEQS